MIKIKTISSYSCIGPRPNQEDYIIAPADNSTRVFVLCDGMGGHGHGEVASKTIADSVYGYLTELNPIEYTEENLQNAVDFALKELVAADIYDDEKAMGTTFVVIVINRMNVLVGHIGDSRCYQFSSDGLKKFRSRDHSKVQEAVDAEILTDEEAWSSPKKNILTRCITSKQNSITVEIDKLSIEDNDCIMLCSDGVTDALKDSQIQSIIIGRSSDEAANIIKTECELSSRDNFSLILISFSQDEPNFDKNTSEISDAKEKYNELCIGEIKFCPHCGQKLSSNAKFCPVCGGACINQEADNDSMSHQPTIEKSFSKWIQNISPIWLIAGGALLGAIVSGAIISCFDNTPEAHSNIDPTLPLNNSGLSENDMTTFISEVCNVDTVNAPNDTILTKQVLQNEYDSFVEKFHQNHK